MQRPTPTNLDITWNGGFFDSDLDLPTNQWALTAMVISPTNATVYLRDGAGLQSTNFVRANPSATFDGNSEIGWDTAGGNGGRLWNGPIADVMVFDSALSPVAVNALYLGVPASAALTIAPSGNNLVVAWPGGTLQEATQYHRPLDTNHRRDQWYIYLQPSRRLNSIEYNCNEDEKAGIDFPKAARGP